MQAFLQKTAQACLTHYKDTISDQIFVFPNRRAGIFFQKYLATLVGKPLFSPRIISVNDLFREFTPYRIADRINLLFILYREFQQLSKREESFDEFVFWGEMILNDFDDVDKYMADARQLFSNVKDLKEIDNGMSGLTDEQVATIREFWLNFQPEKEGKTKEDFLATWEILYPLYESFRRELIAQNTVYEGVVFREVCERILRKEELQLIDCDYIFVGLNALTHSEEILLEHIQKRGVAQFFWDIESPRLTDTYNKASNFITRYARQFPSALKWPADTNEPEEPVIDLIGIPSAIGQSRQVYDVLTNLVQTKRIVDPAKAINTVVVLPDERLLLPTLYSIPESITNINVTMGYPLASSPVAGLMEQIFAMQTHVRLHQGVPVFYFRFLVPVLNHRYIAGLSPVFAEKMHKNIIETNRIYLSAADFEGDELLSKVFVPLLSDADFPAYLMQVIRLIQDNAIQTENEEDESLPNNLSQLESEFMYHYYITINRMGDIMQNSNTHMSSDTFFRLLRKLIAGVSVPFRGEPLSGLQVMGVLETRVLDFDNLIILSMNEGVFPLKTASNSFIPYNLRKGFGLPTYEHQESVYAYHYYRMIHRAKHITMLYDTRSDGMQTGEVSRYVHQMRYHYQMKINQKQVNFDISVSKTDPISVRKSEHIQLSLSRFLEGGERKLSASSINTYLDCPLKFYFQEIEQMREEEEVSETPEASQFGSMFHLIMERLYNNLANRQIQADALNEIQKNDKLLTCEVENAFREYIFKSDKPRELTGNNFLIASVLKRYVKQVLEIDKKLTPFVYRQSEMPVHNLLTTPTGRKVQIKGLIDRVDEVRNGIRIIDYKTGQGDLQFKSIDQLFDKEQKKRPKAVMQVFLYAYLYRLQAGNQAVMPGIYFLRNLFDNFDAAVRYKPDKSTNERIDDFAPFANDFEAALLSCIDEIFDPAFNFTQTSVEESCTYCAYNEICRK